MCNDKLDGYPIPVRNPMGTGTGMNFYPWVRVQISTRSLFADGRVIALPDPNPARCHSYTKSYFKPSSPALGPINHTRPLLAIGLNPLFPWKGDALDALAVSIGGKIVMNLSGANLV
jgi:hypothetical protein